MPKTILKDRVLYSDGDSVVGLGEVMDRLIAGESTTGLFVEELNDDIKQFNKYVLKDEQVTVKDSTRPNDIGWNIPQEYADIDVLSFVVTTFYEVAAAEGFKRTSPWFDTRRNRVVQELQMYQDLNLIPVLRVLIYIINTLREKNVVWGVGRGSSVSSYVLYILGVHDVDSVEYDLDIHEFLRT